MFSQYKQSESFKSSSPNKSSEKRNMSERSHDKNDSIKDQDISEMKEEFKGNQTKQNFLLSPTSITSKLNFFKDNFMTLLRQNINIPYFLPKPNIDSLDPITIDSYKEDKEKNTKEYECQKLELNDLSNNEFTVTISNPRIIETKFYEKNYTLYDINTEKFGWCVQRRYSDFLWLRECLSYLFPSDILMQLPKKKFGKRRFENDFIEKRLKRLGNFINFILSKEHLKTSDIFLQFLSVSDRATFEKYMSLNSPKSFIVKKGENLKTASGKINYIDFDNDTDIRHNAFFLNITNYYFLQKETLEKLHKNFQNFHKSISNACSNLEEIEQNFTVLNQIGSISKIGAEVVNVYEQYKIFFKNWKRILVNQNFLIKECVTDYFKGFLRSTESVCEVLEKKEQLRLGYYEHKKNLNAKKENLWNLMDSKKWELNPNERLDSSKLFSDKSYALENMCYEENEKLKQESILLGYFYYNIFNEVTNLFSNMNNEFSINLENFSNQLQPTLTDYVTVWSNLAGNVKA